MSTTDQTIRPELPEPAEPQSAIAAYAMCFVTKGVRVRASYLKAAPLGTYSLAGAQMKVAATAVTVEGVVTHVWGHGKSKARIERMTMVILPDDGGPEVEVPMAAVTGTLPCDSDPPGLETRAVAGLRLQPDGGWAVVEPDPHFPEVAMALRAFGEGSPRMVPFDADDITDGDPDAGMTYWTTYTTQEEARKAAWRYYAATATKMHA